MSAEHTINPAETALDELLQGHGVPEDAVAETHQGHEQGKSGLPQLDVATFPSQIFWLAFSFALLYWLVSKSALPRIHEIVDKRRDRIERDLGRAERLSEEALKSRQAYEAMHRRAKDNAAAIIVDAQQEIRRNQDAKNADANHAVMEKLQQAEVDMEARRTLFRQELMKFTESLVVRIVQELTGKQPEAELLRGALALPENNR
jgi:F-type H+-transporting ATPase subunit b